MLSMTKLWRRAMRMSGLLVLLVSVDPGIAQTVQNGKPCIAFSPESDSPTNVLARDPLQAAVMLSGDFDFYSSRHEGCWSVHVISLPVKSAKGKQVGYAVSHTITDPREIEVGHALTFGPDQDIFLQAMRKATADAIRNIRLSLPASRIPDAADTAIDARR
jgi:hypothetical protein